MDNNCIIGDCRDSMRMLIEQGVTVQTCVTSPPYWGLRDYGVAGQIGLAWMRTQSRLRSATEPTNRATRARAMKTHTNSDDPRLALIHFPRGRSGDRLRSMMDVRDRTYAALDRRNLFREEGRHSRAEADALARAMLPTLPPEVILLGRDVADAFGASLVGARRQLSREQVVRMSQAAACQVVVEYPQPGTIASMTDGSRYEATWSGWVRIE